MCGNGMWGEVCNYFQIWRPEYAGVVCRQLGFSEDGRPLSISIDILLNKICGSIGAYVVDDPNVFEKGRDAILGLLECVGTEAELLDCSHYQFGYHHCHKRDEHVIISCYGKWIHKARNHVENDSHGRKYKL